MTPQEYLAFLKAIEESGIIDKIVNKMTQNPTPENFLVNAAYILLALLAFKLFVLNGSIKKFFDLEEKKVTILGQIQGEVVELKTEVKQDHQKINDVLRILESKRHTDRT